MVRRLLLILLLGVACIISSTLFHPANIIVPQDKQNNVLVITEPPLQRDLAGVEVLRSLQALPADLMTDKIAVIVDHSQLENATAEQVAILQAYVDNGIAVMAFGGAVQPNEVAKKLGRTDGSSYTVGSKLLADGILIRSDGQYHTIHVAAPANWAVSVERIVEDVQETVYEAKAAVRELEQPGGW